MEYVNINIIKMHIKITISEMKYQKENKKREKRVSKGHACSSIDNFQIVPVKKGISKYK